jgi:hypothetical protein
MRLFSLLLLVFGFVGFAVTSIAQVPATSPPDPGQADSAPQHQQVETPEEAQTARSFKGTILRVKGQLVLKETSAHTLYRLDDQKKARKYEGKKVTVTATMDPSPNILRVIDIVESGRPLPPAPKQ